MNIEFLFISFTIYSIFIPYIFNFLCFFRKKYIFFEKDALFIPFFLLPDIYFPQIILL